MDKESLGVTPSWPELYQKLLSRPKPILTCTQTSQPTYFVNSSSYSRNKIMFQNMKDGVKYLEGQNWTSSTVSSCPWNTPLAWITGLSVGLSSDPPLFVIPGCVAKVDIWSWILHKTTDLSFPANTTYNTFIKIHFCEAHA